MHQSAPFTVIIADSSKLGSVMLERLLAPLLDVQVCADAANLATALNGQPGLLLITNQWPDLEHVLALMARQHPHLPTILTASPDSDAARLASLSEQFGSGVIYRPYEARQVIREIFGLLSLPRVGVLTEAVDTVHEDEAGPSEADPLETVQRDQAFCRRHHLPHSLLALRIDEYASLSHQLGPEALAEAEHTIRAMICTGLRREDHLCAETPGVMVLSLPGTPAQGARVLAHRLCQQIQDVDIAAGELLSRFSLLAGIHIITGSDALEEDISLALATSELASSEDQLQVLLSDMACDQIGSTAPPLLQTDEQSVNDDSADPWEHIAAMLDEEDAEASRQAMQQLTGILRRLDEHARMTLVDELLLASAMPD
jgi:GGDEF domain-containing protein